MLHASTLRCRVPVLSKHAAPTCLCAPLLSHPPAGTPLALPLAGTTAEERYGRCDPPGWPSPCQPYSWRPLQQPHTEWPAAVLQLLAPAAGSSAPAVPTPDAVALAGAAAAGAAVSPEAAFQVALQHEAEQAAAAAAAAEPADPPPEALVSSAAVAAAAAPAAAGGKRSRSGRRRGRGQPAAEEDDEDALEALPLESEAAIEVEGHRVQRHIHSDGGEEWAGFWIWCCKYVCVFGLEGEKGNEEQQRPWPASLRDPFPHLPAHSQPAHPSAICFYLQASRCWWAARRWRRCWAAPETRRSRPPSELSLCACWSVTGCVAGWLANVHLLPPQRLCHSTPQHHVYSNPIAPPPRPQLHHHHRHCRKLGSWLRKCGGVVSKAKLAGPGRHQAVALLRRQVWSLGGASCCALLLASCCTAVLVRAVHRSSSTT